MDGTGSERRVALLVDGDNISSAHAGRLLMRASKLGSVTVKRIYVDPPHLSNWDKSNGFALRVARQRADAADLLLAIEAVDLSHSGAVQAFAIASGDGGFAPLGLFLVERGFTVLGLGPATSPEDWRKSCTRFEVIDAAPSVEGTPTLPASATVPPPLGPETPSSGAAALGDVTAMSGGRPAVERLTDVDKAIVATLVARNGNPTSVALLGSLAGKALQGMPGAPQPGRWHSYLSKRPMLFRLDGTNGEATVRLR